MNSSPTTLQALVTAMARPFVELRSAHQERQQRIQALLFSAPTSAAFISAATKRQTDYSNPSNNSTTTTTSDLTDGSTAEPTVRSEISIPPTSPTTDCVLRSVKPNIIYDTTSNLSTTTNYFKLDMHEHSNNQLLPILKTTNHHSFLSSANMSRFTLQWNLSVGSAPLPIFTVTIAGGSTPIGVALLKFSRKSTHEITSTSTKFYLARSLVQPLIM